VRKVYPPNTTLIVNNPCTKIGFYALGEITKFVVESNYGWVDLGKFSNEVYTKEVVIKRNYGDGGIYLYNRMDRVEIQENMSKI